MSRALDTDDNYVTFGTALEPIEEEEVARKKPITISEQIATDERGRRRFHGAFTGGFSAGYFNTVGSKEGWTPSTFKSSRNERVPQPKGQNVTDFMDDEDIGAFGIAPQVLRPTDDFAAAEAVTSGRKRPKATQSDGPIPGVPVLEQIIEPVKETVGIQILVKMGWRPGQGVGPRVGKTKKLKSKRQQQQDKDSGKIEMPTIVDDEIEVIENQEIQPKRTYGCQLPPALSKSRKDSDGSLEEEFDSDVLYAPEDVDSPLCNPKENTFGLGYKGLDRTSLVGTSGHVDLFGAQLKFRGDNQSSGGVTGEAFGIGAFEEPDQDVYSREDLSQYDFELETMEERRSRKYKEIKDKSKKKQSNKCLDGFRLSKSSATRRKFFAPPHLPPNFEPVHSRRKSRFETAPQTSDASASKRGLGRHALTVQERQVLLGEETLEKKSPLNTHPPESESTHAVKDEFPSSLPPPEKDPSNVERVERIKKFVQVLQAHSAAKSDDVSSTKPVFKPFLRNPEKQDRYDKYLTLVAAGFQDSLKELQPLEMTEWERERERLEFERAADIYKPLSGVMSSRFVSAKSHDISHVVPEKEILKEKDPTEDPKVAARLNLFGKLTHDMVEWHPDKLLCKRFNIKDPYPDSKFVGLRGGPSSRSESTAFPESLVESAPPPILPKKSLFDNLDFSKPPPGLFPVNNSGQSDSEPPPPGTGNDAATEASHMQTKKLDFQPSLEEKENIPVKASLDLFKEIFADSSEESDDESSMETLSKQINTRTSGANSAIERSDKRNDENGKSKLRDDSSIDKLLHIRTEVRSKDKSKHNDEPNPDKVNRKKGIFDDLDLTKLNKGRDREGGNSRESNIDREDEEDDDNLLYGPRLPESPAKPLCSSISNSKAQSSSGQHPILSAASMTSPSMKGSLTNKVEVVWVERNAVSESRSKAKLRHSIKKTKKSKSKKSKSKHKEKHKKGKKHKQKRNKLPKSQSGHSDTPSSSGDEKDMKTMGYESSNDSSSSITIHGSLDQKALLAQLKNISRSN